MHILALWCSYAVALVACVSGKETITVSEASTNVRVQYDSAIPRDAVVKTIKLLHANVAEMRSQFNVKLESVFGELVPVVEVEWSGTITENLHVFEAAKSANQDGDFVGIAFVRHDTVETALNWICNVQRMGNVLGSTVFLAFDETSRARLTGFDRDLRVVALGPTTLDNSADLSTNAFLYGRATALMTLVNNGLSVATVELDTFWRDNVFQALASVAKTNTASVVLGFDDKVATSFEGAALFQSSEETRASLRNLALQIEGNVGASTVVSDRAVLVSEPNLSVSYLPTGTFAWSRGAVGGSTVAVVNNKALKDLPVDPKHWFLNKDANRCHHPDPAVRGNFRATLVVMTMDRAKPLERLLKSLVDADYSTNSPDETNDIRLVIRVDKPSKPKPGYDQVVKIAKSFRSDRFSEIVVDLQPENVGLKAQWFSSFNDPRGWDEVGMFFEDDVEVSPTYFRYLRVQWMHHFYDPYVGSISLQRQTLRAAAPYDNKKSIINDHRPYLYRLIGTWGLSAKASNWLTFTSSYRTKDDVAIDGLITTTWFLADKKRNMWSQHYIHFLWKRDQFTLFINLPNQKTLCSNWQEAGVHYSTKPARDFALQATYDKSILEAYDKVLPRYDFDTTRIRD